MISFSKLFSVSFSYDQIFSQLLYHISQDPATICELLCNLESKKRSLISVSYSQFLLSIVQIIINIAIRSLWLCMSVLPLLLMLSPGHLNISDIFPLLAAKESKAQRHLSPVTLNISSFLFLFTTFVLSSDKKWKHDTWFSVAEADKWRSKCKVKAAVKLNVTSFVKATTITSPNSILHSIALHLECFSVV